MSEVGLYLAGRHGVARRERRRARRGGRRGRVHDRHDRLPGGAHGSELRPRQILTFTAPMIGNYGVEDAASESRRVQPTALICHEARNYAPNGREGLLDWLRGAGGSSRSRASTPARSCATCATAAPCSAWPAARASAARRRSRCSPPSRRWRAGCSPARSPASSTGMPQGGCALPRRRARLRRQGLDRAPARAGGRDRDGAAARRHGGAGRRARARRRAARERPRRSRLDGRARRRGARDGRPGSAALRHLPRPPAARPGARAGDVQAPFGHRGANHPVLRERLGPRARDEPEPRLRGARARERRRRPRGHAPLALRRHGRGPAPARPPGLEHAVPPRGLARAARRAREAGRVRRGLRRAGRGNG